MAGNLAFGVLSQQRDAPIESWERMRDAMGASTPEARKARDQMTIAIESRRHQEAMRRK